MKKFISVLTAVFLVVIMCVPAFAANGVQPATSATVDLASTSAVVGQEITVSYYASSGISGLNAVLTYDTESFEYVSSAAGNMFAVCEINDKTVGEIKAACIDTSVVDGGVAFTVTFKVLKSGGALVATATDAIADGTASIPVTNSKTLVIEEASSAAGTAANGNARVPTTGRTVSTIACGVCGVAACAGAVFAIAKKKSKKSN